MNILICIRFVNICCLIFASRNLGIQLIERLNIVILVCIFRFLRKTMDIYELGTSLSTFCVSCHFLNVVPLFFGNNVQAIKFASTF